MNRRRTAAALFAVIAGVCLGISTFTPWWSFSGTSGGSSAKIEYFPGSSALFSENGYTTAQTYASGGLAELGILYEGVLVFGIAATALALLAGILAVLVEMGRWRTGPGRRAFLLLMVALIVATAVMDALVPLAQPLLIARGSDGCAPTSPNTCNSFWGSSSGPSFSNTWGAGVGWYLAVAAALFLLASLVSWRLARD